MLSVCPVIPIQSLKKSQQRLTSYLVAADRKLQLYNCSTRGSIGARRRLQVRAACGNDGRLQQRRSSLQITVLLVSAGLTTLHPLVVAAPLFGESSPLSLFSLRRMRASPTNSVSEER